MLPIINGVGTLTREPEQRFTQSGSSIVNFGLAFNERYKNKNGQQKESVTFIDCTVFGALGEKVVMPYIHKGSKIFVVGKLKLENWTAQDNSKRSKHSITIENLQMLDSKQDSQANNQGQQNQNSYGNQQAQSSQCGYSQPQQQQGYGQAQQPHNPNQGQQRPPASVPEIDIEDD